MLWFLDTSCLIVSILAIALGGNSYKNTYSLKA